MSLLVLLNPVFANSMPWADVVLLFAGLGLIALALLLSQRLGKREVIIKLDKLGVDFKADRLTFVLLIGLMLIAVGVFFRYRNYETDVNDLQLQVQGLRSGQEESKKILDALRDELREFKAYDLGLNIAFPSVAGDDVEKYFKTEVWIKKGNDPFALSDYKPVTANGQTFVRLSNLNQGQKIMIVARDTRDNTRWQSTNDIVIPETQIEMQKKNPAQ